MDERVKRAILKTNLDKIFLSNLKSDLRGEYIPFCDYYRHRGILGNNKAKICEERRCEHYRIFREER